MEKILMDILGLSTSPSSGGAYALILNEQSGSRRLPIIIGTFEAQAIALELENIKPPRPMTHDLLRNIVQSFDSFVKFVYINDLKDGTFFAQVVYDNNGEELSQDARPSDAIALAIRFKAPIYVSPEVLDEAGIQSDEETIKKEGNPRQSFSTKATKDVETKPASKGDQLKVLEDKLDAAIKNEDYEKAAKIRDEINQLKS